MESLTADERVEQWVSLPAEKKAYKWEISPVVRMEI